MVGLYSPLQQSRKRLGRSRRGREARQYGLYDCLTLTLDGRLCWRPSGDSRFIARQGKEVIVESKQLLLAIGEVGWYSLAKASGGGLSKK
jgi:hypothetical protein